MLKKQKCLLSSNTDDKKDSSNNLRIVQLNVEGITKTKTKTISQVFNNADVLVSQETHDRIDQNSGATKVGGSYDPPPPLSIL